MKFKNKIATSALCAMMVAGGTTVFANGGEVEKLDYEMLKMSNAAVIEAADYFDELDGEIIEDSFELQPVTFKELEESLKENLTKKEKAEIEKIITSINKLEKVEKFEETNAEWIKLDKYMNYEVYELKFDDVKEMLKEDLTKKQLAEVEKLVEKINELEKEQKFDESDKLYVELEKYLSDDMMICTIEPDFEDYEEVECEIEPLKYEDIEDMLKEKLTKKEKAEVKSTLDKINKLEKEEKFEESDKEWESLEKYMDFVNFEEVTDATKAE